jgi:hypothetical protein
MNDYSKTVRYWFKREITNNDIAFLRSRISKADGIESITFSKGIINIEFMPYKLTEVSVKEMIVDLGYPVQIKKNRKPGLLKGLIENLAKSNKESFGTKKLDCCDLKH